MAFVAMLFAFCLWFLRLFLESLGPGDDFPGHRVVGVEAVLGPRFCCHFLVPSWFDNKMLGEHSQWGISHKGK